MTNLTHNEPASRPGRLLMSVATVSAVVVGAAGIVAAQGQRAPPRSRRPASVHGTRIQAPDTEARRADDRGDDAATTRSRSASQPAGPTCSRSTSATTERPLHFKRERHRRIYVDAGDGNDCVQHRREQRRLHGHDRRRRSTAATGTTPWPAARERSAARRRRDDSIDGNGGSRSALMGAGDDTFVWDPGDGSDIVEGQDGNDTMVFNGAAAAEQSTSPPTEAGSSSSVTPATSRWTQRGRDASTSTPSVAPT